MCGRYVNVAASGDLIAEFDAEVVGADLRPSWNVAPTDPVRIIVSRPPREQPERRAVRQIRTARWGLVPSWSRDPNGGARMINARIETVTQKAAFKTAAARRRCLVPALGYYEWQHPVGKPPKAAKIPYFLHDPDGQLLAMAGLYELWPDPALAPADPGRWLWTCTIITQPATDRLGEIHDRSPVLVAREQWADWLDCSDTDPGRAAALLAQLPPARLEPYVVSGAVGNVRNNGPELIAPVNAIPDASATPDASNAPTQYRCDLTA